jgi:glutaredoxin
MRKHLIALSKDRFHLFLLIAMAAMIVIFTLWPSSTHENEFSNLNEQATVRVFFSPQCPHCEKELTFLDKLKTQYPDLSVQTHNIHKQHHRELMLAHAKKLKVPSQDLGTPFLIIGDHYLIGFHGADTTGITIRNWVEEHIHQKPLTENTSDTDLGSLQLPFFGAVRLRDLSLPALAVLLGVVDGFNPCAMWVLAYLISLIIGLKDRTKMITLIGTFLFASGVLYFLFMTAWLNVFLFIGYMPLLTTLIGIAALYMGALNLSGFMRSGGRLVCKVGDLKSRQQTQSRIQSLIASPLSWGSFLGIVALAFTVNSIEFVCSSALPAIFTHVLSVAELSTAGYYGYILLYVFFFMLDDLVIFSAAAFAAHKFAGEKYAGICRAIGGVLLIFIGVLLVFFPEILR